MLLLWRTCCRYLNLKRVGKSQAAGSYEKAKETIESLKRLADKYKHKTDKLVETLRKVGVAIAGKTRLSFAVTNTLKRLISQLR